MSDTGWIIEWRWRSWVFGFTFGPQVWQLSVGPLSVGVDPEMRRFAGITEHTESP